MGWAGVLRLRCSAAAWESTGPSRGRAHKTHLPTGAVGAKLAGPGPGSRGGPPSNPLVLHQASGTCRVTRQKIWWSWTQVTSAKEASRNGPGMFSGTWARHTVLWQHWSWSWYSSAFQQLLWISRCPRLTRCQVRNDSILERLTGPADLPGPGGVLPPWTGSAYPLLSCLPSFYTPFS